MAGCIGVPQEQYDSVRAQLEASQAQSAELQTQLQNEIEVLKEQNETVKAQLGDAQAEITKLRGDIGGLKDQYDIVGATPAETAKKIVKHYHETHVYSELDFYVCADMALDVWNMLKAQGINAVVMIGGVKTGIVDITDSDHAWVMAEVSPGNYLALETTRGIVAPKEDNGLYYKGWAFDSPKEYKRYRELRKEWNLRVDIINQWTSRAKEIYAEYEKEYDNYNELVDEFNSQYVGRPVSVESLRYEIDIQAQFAVAREKEGRYDQLSELIDSQQEVMENLAAEMRGFATKW